MKIAITKTGLQGAKLNAELQKYGVNSIHTEFFTINPINFNENLELDLNSAIFSVSVNAIKYSQNWLKKFKNLDLQFFAIGATSARSLSQALAVSVKFPLKATSEALIQMLKNENLPFKNAVILKGNGGRKLLSNFLQKKGIKTTQINCYKRKILPNTCEIITNLQAQKINYFVIANALTLQILHSKTPSKLQNWLKSCRLCVLSPRLAKLAQQYGWKSDKITVAQRPDNQYLIDLLREQHYEQNAKQTHSVRSKTKNT